MTKQELLQAFYDAWCELEALPVNKGRPSMELVAARDQVKYRAQLVQGFVEGGGSFSGSGGAPALPAVDPAVEQYRMMNQQVQAIPPARPAKTVSSIG